MSPPDGRSGSSSISEQYANNEEIVPTKGQAQSLKNRFAELEKDALKVETASAKIKYVPKRFVVSVMIGEGMTKVCGCVQDTPAPKQVNVEPAVDPTKCAACGKTVYAMEKVEDQREKSIESFVDRI